MVNEWFSGLEPDVKQRMENKIQERKEEDEEDDSWLDNPDFRWNRAKEGPEALVVQYFDWRVGHEV